MTVSDNPFLQVRSMIETPVLDARKWAKIPTIDADVILVDMEDSVPINRKIEGRQRVVEVLRDPSQFGGRIPLPRPNHLSTEWGMDDLRSLADLGVENMLYPKLETAEEVAELRSLMQHLGADPRILACIETPRAVVEVERIAAADGVAALFFGEGDLSTALGIPIHMPDGSLNPTLMPARVRTILAGAAFGCATFEFAMVQDLRDMDEYRRRVEEAVALGATAMGCFYPPQIDVINAVFRPTSGQVADALELIETFDDARQAGNPAITRADGKALLIHDYTKARRLLARAGVDAPEGPT